MKPCLTAVAIFTTSVALAQFDGPLQTRNNRSFSLMFLRFSPASGLLRNEQSEFSVGWSCANDYRSYFGVLEDHETSRFELSYRKGLGKGGELQVEVPYVIRSGGFLDPIIDWWHKSFLGVAPPGRSSAPYGKSVIALPGYTFRSANGIGDTTVRLSKQLGTRAIGSVGIKAPTGNDGGLLGSGAFDLGASLTLNYPLHGRMALYGQLAYIFQGRSTSVPGTRANVMQEALALEWNRNSRDSWILQWQGEDAAIKSGNPVSDTQHRILSLGYRRKLSQGRWLDLHISEDGDFLDYNIPAVASVGPDFTIGARYIVRW